MELKTRIIISAATAQTILIVVGWISIYTGNLMPMGEQASNLISTGWQLIGLGIACFLIELAIWGIVHLASIDAASRY